MIVKRGAVKALIAQPKLKPARAIQQQQQKKVPRNFKASEMRKGKILSKIQPGSSASSSTTATATTKTQRKQPKVQLEGFFCPKCDFKTTQRSQFIDHKRREHRRNDTDAGDVNRNRFVEKFHKAADDGKKKKKLLKDFPASQVSNSRYFCCYCGLEQGPMP